jgi:hypothetical protein
MCKAIKDGGARCAYHVGENASAALVTYVATTTGLGGQATREALADLTVEYADAAEPTRAEVDEFIEQQMFRARHEPTLTEKRRASILRRLHEAIGKAVPSGAQFAAWKNLVAEAWSRVRRRAAVAFVSGALAFSLGACGTPGNDVRPEPTATPAAASATVDPSPEAAALSTEKWTVKNVNIEDRVVDLKGQESAEQARDLIIKVAQDYGFNEQSVKYDGKEGKAESQKWMLAARKDMTPDAASDWTKTVNTYFREKALDGTEAWRDMMSFTNYGMITTGMRPTDPSTPIMFDMTIKDMDVDLSNDGRIWVTVHSSAKFNYLNEGKPGASRADRTQEFWLKDVNGQLKIDGWNGSTRYSAIN